MGASTHPTLAYGSNYFERWNNPNGQPPIGSGAGSGAHGNLNSTTNYSQTPTPYTRDTPIPTTYQTPIYYSSHQKTENGGSDKQTLGTYGQSNRINLSETTSQNVIKPNKPEKGDVNA